MPLAPGSRIGHYDVTAKIGEGGMGEVYRARDTKLDRDVALKVLPDRRLLHKENRPGANVELEKDGDTVLNGPVCPWGSCLHILGHL